MKLVITGGSGFLGYHLCAALSRDYQEIVVVDIAPLETAEYPPQAVYLKIDVRDKERLIPVFKGAHAVVHAAAALPLWKKRDIIDINVRGTRNVLEAAQCNGAQRVVFVSSTAVYGVPDKHPLYENDPLVGVGPYGASKIEAERICEAYRKDDMCVPVVRPKTFIGTGRLGVFQILYDWVESGKKIPIIGKGHNRFQLLEVEDLARAIALLLKSPAQAVNDTFNVGAEKFTTVLEDVTALCAFAGTGARVMPTPAGPVKAFLAVCDAMKVSPLYKWVYDTADKDSYVSIEKIKNACAWAPRYSTADALIRSYAWYLSHKEVSRRTGLTHRVAWKQGILQFIKKFL